MTLKYNVTDAILPLKPHIGRHRTAVRAHRSRRLPGLDRLLAAGPVMDMLIRAVGGGGHGHEGEGHHQGQNQRCQFLCFLHFGCLP